MIDPANSQDVTLSYTLTDDYSCYVTNCGDLVTSFTFTADQTTTFSLNDYITGGTEIINIDAATFNQIGEHSIAFDATF